MAGHSRSRSLSVLRRAFVAGLVVLVTAPMAPAWGADTTAKSAVGFWDRVPGPTLLLIPAAVGLAVLIGVVLGPRGRPSPVVSREGGLSRALARRPSRGTD